MSSEHGRLMARESAEAMEVFRATAALDLREAAIAHKLKEAGAFYTIARGSSDAAANVLSYEMMRELGVPVTSLPPSVFSIGHGVRINNAAALVVSQSGASADLVASAKGANTEGAKVVAIVNQDDAPVSKVSDMTVPIGAGPELAVPATKSVVGSIAAGMALLAGLSPAYGKRVRADVAALEGCDPQHPQAAAIQAAFLRARHIYVIGRDTGYGAAHEIALKLKECCALHAEAYSASEVLHGPLQLATNPLMVLMLDTGSDAVQDSLDQAEARFRGVGCDVHRMRIGDVGQAGLTPAAAAALLLMQLYPIILNTALALGLDPDKPETLSKVTQTR